LLAFIGTFKFSVEVLAKKLASSVVFILWVVQIAIAFVCSLEEVHFAFFHGILSRVGSLPSITEFPLKVFNWVCLSSTFLFLKAANSVFL
jgi:hypothetical protein